MHSIVAWSKRTMKGVGIDRAVFYTVLARGWGVGAGLLTIVLIARFLSPTLQGYYYTFYSLIALQIFVELGLTNAIIQFASHEMARLSWTPEGSVTGSLEAKRRLQSLLYFAMYWFGAAALLMVALLLPLGIHFFNVATPKGAPEVSVALPWSLLVIFAAANLTISAATAVLEGCGEVAQVAVLRLWQSVFSVVGVWSVLSLGGHLYAVVAQSSITMLIGFTWLWVKYRMFFRDLVSHRTLHRGLNWRKEIWPFQWRIGISWISGYLAFQLFNPILLATNGPVAAGKMGMSLQIMNAMNGAAVAWISTKAPTYGKLIAMRQLKALNDLFHKGLLQSLLFLLFGVMSVLSVLKYLEMSGTRYAQRVLPLPLMILLGLCCLANHVVTAEAIYLRAHRREPFMILNVVSGATTAILATLLIPTCGAEGAVWAYATTALGIGLIGGTTIFLKKRSEYAHE